MNFSTFDIIVVAPQIKKLHELLLEAMKQESNENFTITPAEAAAIGSLIVDIANKLKK